MVTLAQQHATGKVLLTTRGRLVLVSMVLAVLALCVALMLTQQPNPVASASHNGQAEPQYQQLIVQPGDTLWEISARLAHDGNRAEVLEQILRYNNLESSTLYVGQTLFVPVGQ